MTPSGSIAHYRVTGKLGEGGMGAVYRATDTKLGRDVAIKVLPDSFASDADRLARFTREAQVLASLNHPNIAAIYGVEERALVMELVEGTTLAERIAQGRMAPEEALPLIRELIDALEYAHDKGVIHRDLKPANLKISPEGRLKVLDFGLAKALGSDAPAGDPASSPTLTMRATQLGVIMGTAAYMAPEQARGQNADRRADIWSFGVVVYEMLTGRQLFDAPTVSDTLAAVLTRDADLASVPARFRRMLRLCLARDARQRLSHISAARVLLDEETAPAAVVVSRPTRLPWVLTGVFALVALALGIWALRPAEQQQVFRLAALPPVKGAFAASAPMISPDGRRIVFTALTGGKVNLWLRNLDEAEPRMLAGTEYANYPFWSPNSRSIGFFASNKLKRVDIDGGPVLTLCGTANGRGATWSRNDVIVFAPGPTSGLLRVSAAGGEPSPATQLDSEHGEISHRLPWFLPDGRHFLYLGRNADPGKLGVFVADLETKEKHRVVAGPTNAIYVAPGYLLFTRERTLMAQPFDAERLRATGAMVPVVDRVDVFEAASMGAFSASATGVLAFYSGGVSAAMQLTWFDRRGKALGTVGQPGGMLTVAISPDGQTVAVDRQDTQSGSFDIWLHDLVHDTGSRFTTNPGAETYPFWSPDSSQILFTSDRDGRRRLYRKAVSSGEQESLVLEWPNFFGGTDWSRDGRHISFDVTDPKTGTDIWVLPDPLAPAGTGRKPFPFVQTEFRDGVGRFSPDGRWVAYMSDQSNTPQIFVRRFPDRSGPWQISPNGGVEPVWGRDGKELFYSAGDGMLMAVEVKSGTKFEYGVPKPLFALQGATGANRRFDVHPDGKRFLAIHPVEQQETQQMTIVTNWVAGLKK